MYDMNHISTLLQHSALSDLKQKASGKHIVVHNMTKIIHTILPQEYQDKVHVLYVKNTVLSIAVESIWVTWVKSYEHNILVEINKHTKISKITWRTREDRLVTQTQKKYNIFISEKSATTIKHVAQGIKNTKLRKALMNISNRTK